MDSQPKALLLSPPNFTTFSFTALSTSKMRQKIGKQYQEGWCLPVFYSPPSKKKKQLDLLPPQIWTMASGEAGGVQQGSKQVWDSDGVNPVGSQRTKRFHFFPLLVFGKEKCFQQHKCLFIGSFRKAYGYIRVSCPGMTNCELIQLHWFCCGIFLSHVT